MPTDTPAKPRMLTLVLSFGYLQHSPLHLALFLCAANCTNALQRMRIGLLPPSQKKQQRAVLAAATYPAIALGWQLQQSPTDWQL